MRAGTVAVVAALGAGALLATATASAGTPGPGAPAGVHVSAVSATSLTVVAHAAPNAHRYRLFVSSVRSDVYAANLSAVRSTRRYASSTKPLLTLARLKFSTAAYYYRFETVNGAKVRVSDIGAAYLRPAAPSSLRISGAAGLHLSWTSGAVTGFRVVQGTDPRLVQNRRTYTLRGAGAQLTPYGLSPGRTYWFRIAALNGSTRSAYSAQTVSARASSREQNVRVMTYNILAREADGTVGDGGEVIAPWNTERKAAAAKLIRTGNPDVISVQEGASWVGAIRGPRQIDSLKAALGAGYTLASTEIPPSQPHYLRTGDYILYRNSTYRTVGNGGFWRLNGDPHYGVYQALQNKASGATLLFVATHLAVGAGASYDRVRELETRSLVSQARAYATQLGGVPIVYAGDFNSYLSRTHTYDGPGRVMQAAHIADGLLAAQALRNALYNSANRYIRDAPAVGYSIDHVFADSGVGVRAWQELLDVAKGRLVGVIPSDHNPVVADLSVPF